MVKSPFQVVIVQQTSNIDAEFLSAISSKWWMAKCRLGDVLTKIPSFPPFWWLNHVKSLFFTILAGKIPAGVPSGLRCAGPSVRTGNISRRVSLRRPGWLVLKWFWSIDFGFWDIMVIYRFTQFLNAFQSKQAIVWILLGQAWWIYWLDICQQIENPMLS